MSNCDKPTAQTGLAQSQPRTRPWPSHMAIETRVSGTDLIDGWATWLGHFSWQWFVTLTFDPKRTFPVSRAVVEREAIWWSHLVAKTVRLPVGWVCAPERGRGGHWHGHVVMLAERARWSPEAVLPVWNERNGRIDLRPVSDRRGLGLYLSKEAAAEGTVVLSDTLLRYRPVVETTDPIIVPLVAPESASLNGQDDD